MAKQSAAVLINQSSGNVEYYSPPEILKRARYTLGGTIDLDPFSSEAANKHVGANRFFTEKDDGFKQPWECSTLWANHPFGRTQNKLFTPKITKEWEEGNIREGALCITYAVTSEQWFKPLLLRPQCFLSPRTDYYLPDGTLKDGVTKGSVVTLYRRDEKMLARFIEAFRDMGVIKIVI